MGCKWHTELDIPEHNEKIQSINDHMNDQSINDHIAAHHMNLTTKI